MCIISILPKGKDKNSEEVITFIKNGFNNNKDGSGFMYKKAGSRSIILSKGYDDLELFLADIKKANLTEEDELVVHHRIGNVGSKNDINTHPFVCSNDAEDHFKLEGKFGKPCLVHNGTFFGLSSYKLHNPNNSDTYAFSRYIMSNKNLQALLKENLDLFQDVMSEILNKGKLCFLFPDRDLIKIGNFIEKNGYFHSNEGFKDGWYRDVGGTLRKKQEPSYLPSKRTGGKNSSTGGASSVYDDYKRNLDKLLLKSYLSLDGSIIRINSLNHKHFVFGYKDPNSVYYDKAFVSQEYSERDIFNPFVYKDANGEEREIFLTNHLIHTDLDFMICKEYVDTYREYIILQRDLDVTKKGMRKLFNQLKNSRFKSFDYKIHVKKLNRYFTRLALIEYYNYYKDEIMRDPTELDLKYIIADEATYINNIRAERDKKLMAAEKIDDVADIVTDAINNTI